MDKVRTKGGGNLGDHSPHCDMGARPALLGSAHQSGVAKTAGGECYRSTGRCTAGFHAIRSALASPCRTIFEHKYVTLNLRLYVKIQHFFCHCQYLAFKILRYVEYFLLNS